MNNKILLLLTSIALVSCVSVKVTKAPNIHGKLICIVNNPEVRSAFRDAYERQLVSKGYATKIVDTTSACDITTTYTATYGFHWGMYLSTAVLTINDHGKEVGRADYSAPYASPAKHGRVEGKIENLVAKLLP